MEALILVVVFLVLTVFSFVMSAVLAAVLEIFLLRREGKRYTIGMPSPWTFVVAAAAGTWVVWLVSFR